MIPLVEAIEQGKAQNENRYASDDLYSLNPAPVGSLSQLSWNGGPKRVRVPSLLYGNCVRSGVLESRSLGIER